MTQFQKEFKKEDAVVIALLLHPKLQSRKHELEDWISYGPGSYTWCFIRCNVKGYGIIDIGLDNHKCDFYGPQSKANIEQHLKDGKIHFNVWRFVGDCKIDRNVIGRSTPAACIKAEAYLAERYQLPSAEEFHREYTKD